MAGDSVELHLYRANDFDLHPYGSEDSTFVTADRIANQIALLNYKVFGYQKFLINDTLLFRKYFKLPSNGDTRTLSLKVATPQNGNAVYCQVLNPSSCVGMSPEDLCVVCYQVNIIVVSNDPDIPYNWPPDAPLPTGGGGLGGGGSGNTGNPPPTNNCTSNNQCQQLRSLIVEGRLPCGGCGSGPITTTNPLPPIDIPVDSIPKIISLAADREMDSLYLWGMNNSFREQSFIVVKKNSQIYPKNCVPGFTSGDQTRVNYTLLPGEELLAYGHIHAEDTTNYWRTSFSPEDLVEFNKNAMKVGYTAILEVGNARYAFVLEDVQKKSTFNISNRGNHRRGYFSALQNLENQITNEQLRTEQAWVQYLGSTSNSGIGFYKATSPNKNIFTKLNP